MGDAGYDAGADRHSAGHAGLYVGTGGHAEKRKSVGERVTEIEHLCAPKKSTEMGTAVYALKCAIADRLPSCGDGDTAYRTIWRREDDIQIRKLAESDKQEVGNNKIVLRSDRRKWQHGE